MQYVAENMKHLETQITGINKLLSITYDSSMTVKSLLFQLGYKTNRVEKIYDHYLDYIHDCIVILMNNVFDNDIDGENLSKIICRRFGLDGMPPDSYHKLVNEYGISTARVKKLEDKAIGILREKINVLYLEECIKGVVELLIENVELDANQSQNI